MLHWYKIKYQSSNSRENDFVYLAWFNFHILLHSQVLYRLDALKKFAKFSPVLKPRFNKVPDLRACKLIKRLQHRRLPLNLVKFLRTLSLIENLSVTVFKDLLLLKIFSSRSFVDCHVKSKWNKVFPWRPPDFSTEPRSDIFCFFLKILLVWYTAASMKTLLFAH